MTCIWKPGEKCIHDDLTSIVIFWKTHTHCAHTIFTFHLLSLTTTKKETSRRVMMHTFFAWAIIALLPVVKRIVCIFAVFHFRRRTCYTYHTHTLLLILLQTSAWLYDEHNLLLSNMLIECTQYLCGCVFIKNNHFFLVLFFSFHPKQIWTEVRDVKTAHIHTREWIMEKKNECKTVTIT